jgi:hypothetical protein
MNIQKKQTSSENHISKQRVATLALTFLFAGWVLYDGHPENTTESMVLRATAQTSFPLPSDISLSEEELSSLKDADITEVMSTWEKKVEENPELSSSLPSFDSEDIPNLEDFDVEKIQNIECQITTKSGEKVSCGTATKNTDGSWSAQGDLQSFSSLENIETATIITQDESGRVTEQKTSDLAGASKTMESVLQQTDLLLTDSDQDGLSDVEEMRLGTDPQAADSDKDGRTDGDEIRSGFNPLQASSGEEKDKIVYESPQTLPLEEKLDTRYEVKLVEVGRVSEDGRAITLRITGKAVPNTLVTLYVYSEPVVVTVKVDGEGNWSYDLDKQLEDGSHEVYVAVTDSTGKITAKSSPLRFIKTAQAVSIQTAQAISQTENQSPLERSKYSIAMYAIFIAVFFLGAALIVVGKLSSRWNN